ncbi:MAG: bifunctional heptose 7-phosphate kinase/heptose 1-phosphate adenyltransferase, partial [bacterium]
MKNRLGNILDNLAGKRILVFGDFMLDEFVFGEISRVSREAPVLILKHRDAVYCPGGAANTVANAASLGAEVVPVGFLGNDPWAETLLSLWPSQVNRDFVYKEEAFDTTCKSRILAGSSHSFRQHVVRIDREYQLELYPVHEEKLANSLREALPAVDGVIISDYSLGNLTPGLRNLVTELGRRHSVPVVVDSRDDPSGYPGATTVTPNITEVEGALSESIGLDIEKLESTCSALLEKWQLEALLVTRGKHGLSLFAKNRQVHIDAFGEEDVVDVTGAGDTVAATYTTALAAGAN